MLFVEQRRAAGPPWPWSVGAAFDPHIQSSNMSRKVSCESCCHFGWQLTVGGVLGQLGVDDLWPHRPHTGISADKIGS